jgi:plasmid replication initiation protein
VTANIQVSGEKTPEPGREIVWINFTLNKKRAS